MSTAIIALLPALAHVGLADRQAAGRAMAGTVPDTFPELLRDGPSLGTLATPHGLRIGSAANLDALVADRRYASVLATEFSSLTAEDVMKWARVEPAPGSHNWGPADRLVAFAERNGQEVYGHALVWHAGLPGWLDSERRTRTELSELLRRHVSEEVSRYRGRIWAWDVVNEPLDRTGLLRESIWSRVLGPGYIADALRWAHAADPGARLYLNDFGIEGINAKSNGMYALVRRLLADGVPIDGVGFQTHWTADPLPASMVANLRRFADLGIDVAITEVDVRVTLPTTPAKLEAQAATYRQALTACLAVPRCVSFTMWGFTDKYSWVPSIRPADRAGAACVYDVSFKTKPAYTALAELLAAGRPR